jgi:hypothetical protein
MKCLATSIARADSSELTSNSLIKSNLMGAAYREISFRVGSPSREKPGKSRSISIRLKWIPVASGPSRYVIRSTN